MTFLWSLLTNRLAGPAMAALSVALGLFLVGALVTNAGLKGKLRHSEADLATARTNYARCQANEATLNTAITVQNAATAALKAEADQRAKAAARAVSDAHRATETLRQRERRVAGSVSHEACGDDLILGSVR